MGKGEVCVKCPKCHEEMQPGILCGRGDNYFLPEGEKRPKLTSNRILEKKHAVLLPPESFGLPFCESWPAAFWCAHCRLLIADYCELMQG